jgi:hypothetical protein
VARLWLLLSAAVVAAGLAAPAAQADLLGGLVGVVIPPCGAPSQPFASVDGDTRTYYAVPNNGFESGTAGWSVSHGAKVVVGNEPWYVSGPGKYSLSLPAGSTALSPGACIGVLDPTLRLFARSNDANGGLRIQVLFRGVTGNLLGVLDFDTLAPGDYGQWSATDDVPSLGALPLLTAYFQVKFTAAQSSGSWQIDDLYVDPWLTRVG